MKDVEPVKEGRRAGTARITPDAPPSSDPREVLVYLHRILTQVAAHDFSEKPPLLEDEDDVSKLLVGFRFVVEELEAAHKERQAELDRLRELDAMKTRFINLVAHELNTPITPMRLQLHLLRNGTAGGQPPERSLAMLDRSLTRLEHLVRDMLEVARMESDRFPLDRSPIDLEATLHEAVAAQRTAVAAAGLRLKVDIEPRLTAYADDARIRQVVQELLSNAIDSTAPGGHVSVEAKESADEIKVTVSDDGTGIPLGHMPIVFQPFAQLSERVPGRAEGTGLALYLCKGIIDRHDGRLWCESDGTGKGARFVFTLPRAGPGAHPNAAE